RVLVSVIIRHVSTARGCMTTIEPTPPMTIAGLILMMVKWMIAVLDLGWNGLQIENTPALPYHRPQMATGSELSLSGRSGLMITGIIIWRITVRQIFLCKLFDVVLMVNLITLVLTGNKTNLARLEQPIS